MIGYLVSCLIHKADKDKMYTTKCEVGTKILTDVRKNELQPRPFTCLDPLKGYTLYHFNINSLAKLLWAEGEI